MGFDYTGAPAIPKGTYMTLFTDGLSVVPLYIPYISIHTAWFWVIFALLLFGFFFFPFGCFYVVFLNALCAY